MPLHEVQGRRLRPKQQLKNFQMKTTQRLLTASFVKQLRAPASAALLFLAAMQSSRAAVSLNEGHTDLAFTYTNGTLAATVHRDDIDYEPDEAVLIVRPNSFGTIPDDPRYRFLGVPGTGVWVLPEVQDSNLLFLGLRTESIVGFSNAEVVVRLVSVAGPGQLALFNTDPIGTPLIYMDTGDGIGASDAAAFSGDTHAHYNWTFSHPGDYVLTLEASGMLTNGASVSSGPIDFTFTVEATNVNPVVLDVQHVDIGFALGDGEWDLHIHNETDDEEYAPNEALLFVGPASYTTVPNDPRYGFLGLPCSGLWILPQVQNTNLLFLGFGAEEIEEDALLSNEFRVELKAVTGPGDFIVFDIDPFGSPIAWMSSRDGVDTNDARNLSTGAHSDLNWAFTAPGLYRITLEASGTLSNGTFVSSGAVEYTFYVESTNTPPVILTNQHVDIGFAFEDGEWEPHIHNETDEAEYDPGEAVLLVRPQSFARVPDDPRFAFLGTNCTPYWVLANTQNTNLLFLGFGAEEIEDDVFTNNQFRVELLAVDGPGDFFVYDFDAFGAPVVNMNSADGIDANDFRILVAGAHSDLNWAFTRPGVYRVTFEASGTLTNGEFVASGAVEYTFCIENAPIRLSQPTLTITRLVGGNVTVSWLGESGANYQLQSKTSLSDEWANVGPAITGACQAHSTAVAIDGEARFFRVVATHSSL
jgi:surface-anchored protein